MVGCKSHMKEKGAFPDYLTSRLVMSLLVLFNSCELVLERFFLVSNYLQHPLTSVKR